MNAPVGLKESDGGPQGIELVGRGLFLTFPWPTECLVSHTLVTLLGAVVASVLRSNDHF